MIEVSERLSVSFDGGPRGFVDGRSRRFDQSINRLDLGQLQIFPAPSVRVALQTLAGHAAARTLVPARVGLRKLMPVFATGHRRASY
jgi:hypothetical protein